MFRFMVLVVALTIAACAPVAERPVEISAAVPATPGSLPEPEPLANGNPVAREESAQKPLSAGPILPSAYHHTSSRGVNLSVVCFDDRQYHLRVTDQPTGPGTIWTEARKAAEAHKGVAAINGGFFTLEGKPLGLLIEMGVKRGHINQSSLGSGMFVSSPSGSAIIRREQYSSSRLASRADNLLQAGPMLVERGIPVPGLSRDKHRPRSFIAWNGGHHWAIGYAGSCSLAGLATALADTRIEGFKTMTALNLDGGRSSDLWVGSRIHNGNKSHRSFLNKPVRNYLVLISR